MEKCYWKRICETESQEGLAFIKRFVIDSHKCRVICEGYSNQCDYYTTSQDVNEGKLAQLVRGER